MTSHETQYEITYQFLEHCSGITKNQEPQELTCTVGARRVINCTPHKDPVRTKQEIVLEMLVKTIGPFIIFPTLRIRNNVQG